MTPMTSGVAEAGLLSFDAGTRSASPSTSGGGGASFAQTLGEQMQPKREAPPAEKQSREAEGGEKTTNPKAAEQRESEPAAEKKEATGQADAAQEEKAAAEQEASAEEGTTPGGEEAASNNLSDSPGLIEYLLTADESGKNLPSAEKITISASALFCKAFTAGEQGDIEGAAEAEGAGKGREGGVTGSNGSDALLLALRLGGQATGGSEGDSFADSLKVVQSSTWTAKSLSSNEMIQASPTQAVAAPITTTAPTTGAAPATVTVNHPMSQPGWGEALGEKVIWMTGKGIQEAQIQVNPRELGPIEVRVTIHQDQASVTFTAQTAGAKDALEGALPRLREMFSESGLNLVQSDVSQQSSQQREGRAGGERGAGGDLDGDATEDGAPLLIQATSLPGNVDYYA